MAIILGILPVLNAGEISDSTYKVLGFNMYYAYSASGYGKSLNMNMSIEREKRQLEIGVILQEESAQIFGGEILYRHYLSDLHKNENSRNPQYRNLRVYFQYNFIFRNNTLPDRFETIPSASEDNVVPGGRVATFEHYAGAGVQVKLLDNFFLNAGLGYGIILGSVKEKFNGEPHYTMGGNKNDFGLVVRFGLGYLLKK